MTLIVGVHPNNLHLQIAALTPSLGRSSDIRFVNYAEGRQTGALIAAGTIDLGGTGSTPPLIAQEAGIRFHYVAASAPRASNGAIMVRATGPSALAGLGRHRIALLDGSFHSSFLAAALDTAGLSLADVTLVEMAPDAALAALREGRVDAWIAMEPLLGSVEKDPDLRVLAWIGEYARNRSVFWATESAVRQKSPHIEKLLRELCQLGADISRNPEQYAKLLTQAAIGATGQHAWTQALKKRDWSLHPIDRLILAEQQEEADLLFRHHALPSPIRVDDRAPPVPIRFE